MANTGPAPSGRWCHGELEIESDEGEQVFQDGGRHRARAERRRIESNVKIAISDCPARSSD
jgi:hypothetical protein